MPEPAGPALRGVLLPPACAHLLPEGEAFGEAVEVRLVLERRPNDQSHDHQQADERIRVCDHCAGQLLGALLVFAAGGTVTFDMGHRRAPTTPR